MYRVCAAQEDTHYRHALGDFLAFHHFGMEGQSKPWERRAWLRVPNAPQPYHGQKACHAGNRWWAEWAAVAAEHEASELQLASRSQSRQAQHGSHDGPSSRSTGTGGGFEHCVATLAPSRRAWQRRAACRHATRGVISRAARLREAAMDRAELRVARRQGSHFAVARSRSVLLCRIEKVANGAVVDTLCSAAKEQAPAVRARGLVTALGHTQCTSHTVHFRSAQHC